MKNLEQKKLCRPSKQAAIIANWFRVGIIGFVALPYLLHSLSEIIW